MSNLPRIETSSSSEKRILNERFMIDPFGREHRSKSSQYANRIELCCKEILKKYRNHAQSQITIPEDFITEMCEKHEVSVIKITRILNYGKKPPVYKRKI